MTTNELRSERAAGRVADERHPHWIKGAPATPQRALVTLERNPMQRHAGAPINAVALQVFGQVVLGHGHIAAGRPARLLVGTNRRRLEGWHLMPADAAPSPTTLPSNAKERHR